MMPREFLAQFFDAMTRRDMDALTALLHPEFVEEYPQSGERIRGPANARAIIENYPGGLGEAVQSPSYHGRDEDWVITPHTPWFGSRTRATEVPASSKCAIQTGLSGG